MRNSAFMLRIKVIIIFKILNEIFFISEQYLFSTKKLIVKSQELFIKLLSPKNLFPFMKQQKKKTFKQKIRNAFSFLCATSEPQPKVETKSKQKTKRILKKKETRQTLNLEHAFLKISRKNIIQEELPNNQIITLQLEKHLNRRLMESTITIVKGQFSEKLIQKLPFYLFLSEQCPQDSNIIQKDQLLHLSGVNLNKIDTLILQTFEAHLNQHSNTKFISELEEIDLTLKNYHKIENIVFICTKHLPLNDINKLFLAYERYYLFEIEKIRMSEKLVGYVIYCSHSYTFLKLNTKLYARVLAEQLQSDDHSQEEVEKLFSELVEKGYCREVQALVRYLKLKNTQPLFENFIESFSKKYPESDPILHPYKSDIKIETFIHDTPLFAKHDCSIKQQKQEPICRDSIFF